MKPSLLSAIGSFSTESLTGEDRLNDGSVEVHHHSLWQVELLQLAQEEHPLLAFFGEGPDVELPF